MELRLLQGSDKSLMRALVKRRKFDNDGKKFGTEHSNPLTDTRSYEVELIDGTTQTFTDNIITKNLLAQVDEEGHRKLRLDKIIDYRRNSDAVHKDDTFVDNCTGIRLCNMTTNMDQWIGLYLRTSNHPTPSSYPIFHNCMAFMKIPLLHGGFYKYKIRGKL